jgi:NAD(P)-dependent dehydrogenase (short-subunit alcohol dehydrogenase family)
MSDAAKDLQGKRILVTGASAGIGKQTALELATRGAEVIIVGRSAEKTQAAADELARDSGRAVEVMLADLSSVASVRQLAATFLAKYSTLDVLVNNAGALNPKRETTVDGYERTFATNHLAYFLLTELLLPALRRADHARVVNVSSEAYLMGRLDFDDLMAERGYGQWKQYGRSKLANIYFTRELARRTAADGITVNALHPGFVASNFLQKGGIYNVMRSMSRMFALDVVGGARTSVYLASSPEVAGVTGKYFRKCKERSLRTFAEDDEAARRLWDASEALVAAVA